MNKGERTRERLLKVGRTIALEEGAPQLTLDLLAERAGVSKGGVLYHFGTKRRLFEGVVESFLDDFERSVEEHLEAGAESYLQAYIRASFPQRRAAQLRETSTLFAILALEPDLLPMVQKRFYAWHERARQGTEDSLTASLVRSAIDGLWYNEMFGLCLASDERDALLERLEEMARRG